MASANRQSRNNNNVDDIVHFTQSKQYPSRYTKSTIMYWQQFVATRRLVSSCLFTSPALYLVWQCYAYTSQYGVIQLHTATTSSPAYLLHGIRLSQFD